MLTLRKRHDRGHADHGWLDTYHSFSFANYHDRNHMGFRALRVINDDRIAPARGFGRHPHQDMEIITYVLEGALQHADSMGNGSTIHAGQFQKMSAGTGIEHSEFNASRSEALHLYQIWMLPQSKGIDPGYAEAEVPEEKKQGNLVLVAAPEGEGAPIPLHQDARLYVGRPTPGTPLSLALAPGRHAWVQVTKGSLQVNGQLLEAGDGAAISEEPSIELHAEDGEVLIFDLA